MNWILRVGLPQQALSNSVGHSSTKNDKDTCVTREYPPTTLKGEADMFGKFEKKFGEGTAFDLDYGKLMIIGLLIYHIFF